MSRKESIHILLVEDDQNDTDACKQAAQPYGPLHECEIRITACRSVEEVSEQWNEHSRQLWEETGKAFFDGAIIDLRLNNSASEDLEGNSVALKLQELAPRMPLVIRTGTPAERDSKLEHIRCLSRDADEAQFDVLFDWFRNIRRTGLTDLLSRQGPIEQHMNAIFQKVLMKEIDTWIEHAGLTDAANDENAEKAESVEEKAEKAEKVKKALLRRSLNHLLDLPDVDDEEHYPEEYYLMPLENEEKIRTGNILQKEDGSFQVIMNPACDLVIRKDGSRKATHLLLASVKKFALKEKKEKLQEYCRKPANSKYCLPSTASFRGGQVNFCNLESICMENARQQLESMKLVCRLSPPFMKDMIARFGACYSRQGQPDIMIEAFLRYYRKHYGAS